MQLATSAFESRLRRLESQNRYLRAGLAALAALALTAAAAQPDQVTSGAFVLRDASGAVRAELAIRDGVAGLYIMDEQGRDRLAAIHDTEQTGLFLKDESGHSRVGVAQFAHGGGGVALHGPETRGAVVLYYKDEGSLRFFSPEGVVTRVIRAESDARTTEPR